MGMQTDQERGQSKPGPPECPKLLQNVSEGSKPSGP